MAPWNRRFLLDLLETIIFSFHVKLGEGNPSPMTEESVLGSYAKGISHEIDFKTLDSKTSK